MLSSYDANNYLDANGNPSGGFADATGIHISWQNGPLGRGDDRQPPNGAFVETVIDIAAQRLAFYQDSKFACRENAEALKHLESALYWLSRRTADREARAVEGTHVV